MEGQLLGRAYLLSPFQPLEGRSGMPEDQPPLDRAVVSPWIPWVEPKALPASAAPLALAALLASVAPLASAAPQATVHRQREYCR